MAPGDFGQFSNDLLVGNFGDGRVNAFDPATGNFTGSLSNASNNPLQIDGLWGLVFGNDGSAGATKVSTSRPASPVQGRGRSKIVVSLE